MTFDRFVKKRCHSAQWETDTRRMHIWLFIWMNMDFFMTLSPFLEVIRIIARKRRLVKPFGRAFLPLTAN